MVHGPAQSGHLTNVDQRRASLRGTVQNTLLGPWPPCCCWGLPTTCAEGGKPVCRVQTEAEQREAGGFPGPPSHTGFPSQNPTLRTTSSHASGSSRGVPAPLSTMGGGPDANKKWGDPGSSIKSGAATRKLPVGGRREAGAEWISDTTLLLREPRYHQQCQAALQQSCAGELAVASCLSAVNSVFQGFKEWFCPSTDATLHQRELQSPRRAFVYNTTEMRSAHMDGW